MSTQPSVYSSDNTDDEINPPTIEIYNVALEILLGPLEILLGPLKVSTDRDAGASATPTGAPPHIEQTSAQASFTWVYTVQVRTGQQVHSGVWVCRGPVHE